MVITDKSNLKMPTYLQPISIGILITVIGQAFDGSLNSARDFGARLFVFLISGDTNLFRYHTFKCLYLFLFNVQSNDLLCYYLLHSNEIN